MGDMEGAAAPSKKRFAAGQLSRDNPGLDDDGPEPEMGTFQRASDEVLATRRIVKVRRHQPPTASSAAPNPFAGLLFATKTDLDTKATGESHAPSSTESNAQPSEVSTQTTDQVPQQIDDGSELKPEETFENKETEKAIKENDVIGSKDDGQNGELNDNEKLENSAATEKDVVEEVSCAVETVKEVKNGKLETESESRASTEKGGTETNSKEREETALDVRKGNGEQKEAVPEDGEGEKQKEAAHEVTVEGGERKEVVPEDGHENAEQKVVENDQKGKTESVSPLKSFQQLSSSQNAFSGLAGTGFSSTSFSFGSIAKEGSSFGTASGSFLGLNNEKPSYPSFNPGSVKSAAPLNLFGTAPSGAAKSGGGSIPALQEVPLETGEENEKVAFSADAVLFEYLDGSWKERGKGELKVNVSMSDDPRARLVMRAKGNYRLILNASLFPDMSLTNMEKRGVTFACVNSSSEGKAGLATFALKFKDASVVEEFRGAVAAHKGRKSTAVLKTPENSPKASDV